MPPKSEVRGWINHVLGKGRTETEISAARSLHLNELHDGDQTVKVKLKPAAKLYFIKLALEKLTPEQVFRLRISHILLGEHKFNPEDKTLGRS